MALSDEQIVNAPFETQSLSKLRSWRAAEGIRQAELLLQAQTSNLLAMETRATSILTWSVAGVTGLSLAMGEPALKLQTLAPAISLALAGASCVLALWPREWATAGFQSMWEDALILPTQTETQESMAITLNRSIDFNIKRLRLFGIFLQLAWAFFLAAPTLALAIWIGRVF